MLRKGILDSVTGLRYCSYAYQLNCYQIFDNYFLKNNPFYDICDISDGNSMEYEGSLFGSAFSGLNQPKLPPMPSIEVTVPTTLQEFYNGCFKTVSFEKQIVSLDGKSISKIQATKEIEIKPGMDVQNSYSFVGEGHQQPGRSPSNLYIYFKYEPTDSSSPDFKVTQRYTRMKNDLLYRHKISLQDALLCSPVKIPLLDGRQILLAID